MNDTREMNFRFETMESAYVQMYMNDKAMKEKAMTDYARDYYDNKMFHSKQVLNIVSYLRTGNFNHYH